MVDDSCVQAPQCWTNIGQLSVIGDPDRIRWDDPISLIVVRSASTMIGDCETSLTQRLVADVVPIFML